VSWWLMRWLRWLLGLASGGGGSDIADEGWGLVLDFEWFGVVTGVILEVALACKYIRICFNFGGVGLRFHF